MDLTTYRQKNNLTQSDFAAAMTKAGHKTTQALVSHWETGEVVITAERAVQIETITQGAISRSDLRPDLWAPTKTMRKAARRK